MHSWRDLRAEILQQEIMELEEQPVPKDLSASIERQRRILTLRRELASLWAEDKDLISLSMKELMGKVSKKPDDVSEEEIVKVADVIEKKVKMMEAFAEKESMRTRGNMQQAWQRASLPQRGRIAALYSLHRLGWGLRRIPYHGLHYILNVMRRAARK